LEVPDRATGDEGLDAVGRRMGGGRPRIACAPSVDGSTQTTRADLDLPHNLAAAAARFAEVEDETWRAITRLSGSRLARHPGYYRSSVTGDP
jgi:hypothetical protein